MTPEEIRAVVARTFVVWDLPGGVQRSLLGTYAGRQFSASWLLCPEDPERERRDREVAILDLTTFIHYATEGCRADGGKHEHDFLREFGLFPCLKCGLKVSPEAFRMLNEDDLRTQTAMAGIEAVQGA